MFCSANIKKLREFYFDSLSEPLVVLKAVIPNRGAVS